MIKRDGYCTSLWQDNIQPYNTSNKVENDKLYDIIIVGGGITGVSTALLLQEAGKKCLLLEAANLCFGTTGGTTAHLNTLLDTPYSLIQKNFSKEAAQQVAQATAQAIQLIRDNISKYHIDCGFSEADAFLFAQDEKQEKELSDITDASKEAGLIIEDAKEIPVPISFTKAIRVKGQAKFNPVEYVFALATAFEKAGGVILQQCRVLGIDNDKIITVETAQAVFTAIDLVYATHIPPGVNLIHLRCMPYRSYAMAVTLEDQAYPENLCYDMVDPYHYYRTQEVNGQSYLIAGGKDHKTGHNDNTQHCFLELESTIRQHFRVKEINYKWSSQYFEPADGLPYIGHLPGQSEHIYVASGFGGNGMVYSSVAAILLKQMILKEKTVYADLFNPNRIKPVAGFTNFLSHNADVVKQFVKRLFSGEEINQLSDLAAGEAKVVVLEKEKIALYKNESGQLHGVSPVCTHLKCEVQWNNAERSWDCPCHGARYNFDGEVITGPADRSLKIVDLLHADQEKVQHNGKELIPENLKGKAVDLEESVTLSSRDEALNTFKRACKRLQNPSLWHKLTGALSAEFILTGNNGDEEFRLAKKGDHFKIDIPGPGNSEGNGYDWVKVESIENNSDATSDEDSFGIKLRACSNPTKEENTTAHFFKNDATSSFIIHRKENTVTVSYHGRNEVPNTDTNKKMDNVRNSIIATGAALGLSELHWSTLIKGFLKEEVPF